MGDNRAVRPPFSCRALVRIAAWVAPPRARAEWREKWDSQIWSWWILFERGELTLRDRAQLLRYSWGSLADAFWLRFSREHLRHSMRSAQFVLATAAVALIVMAAATHGFRGVRMLFKPLPLDHPEALVTIRYNGPMGAPYGVPPRLVPFWRDKTKLLSGVAGYMRPSRTDRALVTTNFFTILGVRPALGRVFRAGDGDVAVLSYDAWRVRYSGDPGAIGKTITADHKPYSIVGVLPEGFWAISPNIDMWAPLTLDPQPALGTPFLIGVVGRLKPGVSKDRLRTELWDIAKETNQFRPRPPEVTAFSAFPVRPYVPYLFCLIFGLLAGAAVVWRAIPRPTSRGRWPYWAYLSLKTLLLVAIPSLFWVEAGGALWAKFPMEWARWFLAALLPLSYTFVCAFAVWWSFADQRRRCPVCLYLLGTPVTFGLFGSVVLDPASTEMLCDSGHGSLNVPDAELDLPPDRWTNLDPSWSELFRKN